MVGSLDRSQKCSLAVRYLTMQEQPPRRSSPNETQRPEITAFPSTRPQGVPITSVRRVRLYRTGGVWRLRCRWGKAADRHWDEWPLRCAPSCEPAWPVAAGHADRVICFGWRVEKPRVHAALWVPN